MVNIYRKISFAALALVMHQSLESQCGSSVSGGSASNMFTQIRNSTNPVAADKNLNTVVFIHRNNASVFGGNSGNLRYDISTNAGATWTVDQGPLNPLNSQLGRYPNVTIYNPTLNTTPSNAYLGYMAATIHTSTSAWNGMVTGVRSLGGTGNTENYNQAVISPQFIAHSIVKGAPGVFWAIDGLFNGSYITGFAIYKGTWSSLSNDIVWTQNYTVTPSFNTGFTSIPQIGEYNIAFDPTGQKGWFSFLGHITPGPSNYAYYPVFYKTLDGGATWTGPYQVDLNNFSCITSSITSPNVPTTNFEHDLVVDVNGNPHLLTTVCAGTNAYTVLYGQNHYMYDFTLVNGVWAAYSLGSVNAGRGTWGQPGNTASMDMAPQAARSADGTKLFFTWSDNSNYTLGASNLTPNFFGKGLDITQQKWTPTKDFSSCSSSLAGKILFPHMAPEVLEPSTNNFKLAPVYGEYTVPGDPLQVSNFLFLDNAMFSSTDFSISIPTVSITIQQGSSLLLCQNSTVNINVVGPGVGQAVWNNGATSPTIGISTSTLNTYIVTAQKNCLVGSATITVVNMTVNASAAAGSVCPGSSTTLSVTGNATGYTWTPGNSTGTSVVVTVSNNPVFTVNAGGSGCVTQKTVNVNILQTPTISILGKDTVCSGYQVTFTATGGSGYNWSTGSAQDTLNFTVTQNTTYVVIGTAANTCTGTASKSIVVKPSPTITTLSSHTAVCVGQTMVLTAFGQANYLWSTGAVTSTIAVSPPTSTVYFVTATGQNSCSTIYSMNVIINPLPTLSVSSTKTVLCKGEKTTLSASGAASYTWTSPASTNTSILVSPTITTTYTLIGKNANACTNTYTFAQVVDPCLGINETRSDGVSISVFPNPNSGNFIITSGSQFNAVILNQVGQIVRTLTLNEGANTVNCEGLCNGIYFICGDSQYIIPQKLVITGR